MIDTTFFTNQIEKYTNEVASLKAKRDLQTGQERQETVAKIERCLNEIGVIRSALKL